MRNMQQIKTFHRTIRPLTPANNTNTEPWQIIQADLFGPWSFTNVTGKLCTIKALSIIDTATRWIKLIPYDDKRSKSIALLFDRKWLCRYPRPFAVIFDNGTEFSTKFTKLLESYSILARPSTVKNPQTNSIVERVHQVIGDAIRSMNLPSRHLDKTSPAAILSAVAWGIRSTFHSVLCASPGQVVFGRNIVINAAYVANWKLINACRTNQALRNNCQENQC